MHMAHSLIIQTASAMALLVACSNATAQAQRPPSSIDPFDPAQLQRVQEGGKDENPLAADLQVIDPGLAVPTGFTSVYRVPGRSDLYMRIDGAIHAVFPRSSYVGGRDGLIALIPDDTVYFIGFPSSQALTAAFGPGPARDEHAVFDALDVERSATRLRNDEFAPPPAIRSWRRRLDTMPRHINPRDTGPPIVSDTDYRARRIADLLMEAARVEVARRTHR